MTLLAIRIWGDPCLTCVARPVGAVTDRVRTLAADLTDTMYDAPGRGLAAPQVGESLRMFVVDAHWKDGRERDPLVMVDPEILWRSETVARHTEGCLSIPDLPMKVARPAELEVAWTGLDGTRQQRAFSGIEAVCIQHEYDHLDGILIPDRVTAEDRAELEPALRALALSGATA